MAFAPTLNHVSLFAATSADIDFAWQSVGFKSHGEPARAVTAALDVDTVPTWVVAAYRGRISIISGAFACRYDGPASRRTFATGLYVERVLLRAISGSVPEAPSAAAISLPPCAGRCRAGAWPSPGTGGGSDRANRLGCGPFRSLVGPPQHVLQVLNGCVGTKARNEYKPRRRRT